MAIGGTNSGPRLSAEMSVLDAAALCLHDRLSGVAERLNALNENPEGHREVHALRVSTRRASSTLAILRPLLDPRLARRARKHVRRLRRAAATVRFCDVQSALLHERAQSADHTEAMALDLVIGWIDGLRDDARKQLKRVRRRITAEKLERDASRLVESLRPALVEQPADADTQGGPGAPTFALSEPATRFATLARAALASFADDFMAAASVPSRDFERLHQVRLKAKRIRYALELLGPALHESLAEAALVCIRKLQDRLGEVNDRHELAALVREHASRLRVRKDSRTFKALAAMEASLTRERDEMLAEFDRWWSARRESFFDALRRLSHPAPPQTAPASGAPDDTAGFPARAADDQPERTSESDRLIQAPELAPAALLRPHAPLNGVPA